MREENIQIFSDEQEEFIRLLTDIGLSRTVATVLAYFITTHEGTSREIERATDMRQPEVSIAMKYLIGHGWVKSRNESSSGKGRPFKVFELAVPVMKIMDGIEKEKKEEAKRCLAQVKKLREYC